MKVAPYLCLLALVTSSLAAASQIVNARARTILDLDGKWATIVDPYDNGYLDYRGKPYDETVPAIGGYFLDHKPKNPGELVEYNFDQSDTLWVPRDWNSQSEKLFYYEGTVWYRRKFAETAAKPDRRYFVHFGGANYESDVYLNGEKLGRHVGGFTPFAFEVTGKLKGENSLVVRVNNQRHLDAVPTVNTDWWNYGGLTRDVLLVEVPSTFIADYSVKLDRGAGDRAAISVQLDGTKKQQTVHFRIPELAIDTTLNTDANGVASAEVALTHLQRWSPQNPHLYAVEWQAETDQVSDRVGFRTIETRGRQILLNGEPIFLRGVSIHEENPLRGGRAATVEDARLLLTWAKELGCNFARLAHYPHNEYMARMADEMGLLLWEEIPVYWTIQWENPSTLANARNQLSELIARDHNRASVIVWSVANETPISEPRTRFLKTLVDDARRLDGTRLVSAAMEMRKDPREPNTRIIDDPFGEYTDLVSFNEYVGWYDGLPESCKAAKWSVLREKPVVISEFGGDALGGLHGEAEARFTEEFQAELYRETLPMLERLPGFSGCTPWVLVDFRSPRRPLPHIQDGFNRKGLISENDAKKEAFYVLKSFYDEKAKKQ